MKDIIPPDSFKPKYKVEKKKGFFSFLKRRKPQSKKPAVIPAIEPESRSRNTTPESQDELANRSGREFGMTKGKMRNDKSSKQINVSMDMARVAKKPNPPMRFKKAKTNIKLKSRHKRNAKNIKSKGVNWTGIAVAFLIALLIVMIYFVRDRLPYIDYLNYFLKLKKNITKSLNQPAQINFLPSDETKLTTLGYWARQKKEKIEVLALDSKGDEKVLYSFIGSNLQTDSVALSNNYLSFIDSEGIKLYSFKTKQTDLIMATTQIAQPQKVYLSPEEKFVAFFVLQNNQYRLFLYSIVDNQIRDRNFLADNLIFGAKSTLYFSNGHSFYTYDYVKNTDETKITDFDSGILAFYKTDDALLFTNGVRKKISLWQINESSSTATKLADFNLTFDYTLDDFGVAKKENDLYVSLAGETLVINMKTKEKKNTTLGIELYKLVDFEKESGYFFAFKKPAGLDEFSLLVFKPDENKSLFESAIEEKIIYLK